MVTPVYKHALLRTIEKSINIDRVKIEFRSHDGRDRYPVSAKLLLADADQGNNALLLDGVCNLARQVNPGLTRKHLLFFADPLHSFNLFRRELWSAFARYALVAPPGFCSIPEELYQTKNIAFGYDGSPSCEAWLRSSLDKEHRVIGVPGFEPDFFRRDGFYSRRLAIYHQGKTQFATGELAIPLHAWLDSATNPGFQFAAQWAGIPVTYAYPFSQLATGKYWVYQALKNANVPVPETIPLNDLTAENFNLLMGKNAVIKPDYGFGGNGVHFLNKLNKDGLRLLVRRAAQSSPAAPGNDRLLIQEQIELPEKYTWRDETGRQIGWIAGVFVAQRDSEAGPFVPEIAYYSGPADQPINAYLGAEKISEAELFSRLKISGAEKEKMVRELQTLGRKALAAVHNAYREQATANNTFLPQDLAPITRLDVGYDGTKFVVFEANFSALGALTEGGGAVSAWLEIMAGRIGEKKRGEMANREWTMAKPYLEMVEPFLDYKNFSLMATGGLASNIDYVKNNYFNQNTLPFELAVLAPMFILQGQLAWAKHYEDSVLPSFAGKERPVLEQNLSLIALESAFLSPEEKVNYLSHLNDLVKGELEVGYIKILSADYFVSAGDYESALSSLAEKPNFMGGPFRARLFLHQVLASIKFNAELGAGITHRKIWLSPSLRAKQAFLQGNLKKTVKCFQKARQKRQPLTSLDSLLFGLSAVNVDRDLARQELQRYVEDNFNQMFHLESGGALKVEIDG